MCAAGAVVGSMVLLGVGLFACWFVCAAYMLEASLGLGWWTHCAARLVGTDFVPALAAVFGCNWCMQRIRCCCARRCGHCSHLLPVLWMRHPGSANQVLVCVRTERLTVQVRTYRAHGHTTRP